MSRILPTIGSGSKAKDAKRMINLKLQIKLNRALRAETAVSSGPSLHVQTRRPQEYLSEKTKT